MKRWAWLVAGLYFLALTVLTAPVILAAFAGGKSSPASAFRVYAVPAYWIWIGVMLLGQGVLLLVPVLVAEKRLKSRRALAVPVVTSALFLALLVAAGGLSLWCGVFGDRQPDFIMNLPPGLCWWNLLAGTLALWLGWGLLFRRFAISAPDAESLVRRLTGWLLRGSILELLVAVPCHIVTRHRNDCCAPMGTFLGIAFGVSVMLLAFGPGVFFLFVERLRRLRPPTAS